ncbi:transporter substrate-binding domain-containing protein [filamentous cyanobacterium LEGE 11480]|uniref:Transporter substrate-binding domain-containing protein n=1 Tax=Romeriopsis navalis LEGE 11480 TaxID=2777977 RepID=A0A928VT53_9CYAN|nr:transporter substrate-binding domain-containing protein [Romeriopsis navalis]MBE9033248.1 transporter substrate-binding domain-containing protein [Romeriopsis navalis LEGE 11480]
MRQVINRLARIAFLGWLGVHFFAPPSVYGADLKTIRARGYLIVGVKDNVRPLGFRDRQNQLTGFEIDIARRLAKIILGKPDAIRLVPLANRDRLSMVANDKVDLAIAQITATRARARIVHFSSPYYLNGISLITQPSPNSLRIAEPKQLVGKRVGVLNNSAAIASLQYHQPKLQVVGFDSYTTAQAKLQRGEIQAFAGSTTVLTGWAQTNSSYQLIPTQFDRQPLSVAFPKGLQYADLATIISQSLRQWQQTGWLKERASYWGLP